MVEQCKKLSIVRYVFCMMTHCDQIYIKLKMRFDFSKHRLVAVPLDTARQIVYLFIIIFFLI